MATGGPHPECTALRGRHLTSQAVAVTRETAPWQGLVDSGRGEQVVAESRFGATRARTVPLPDDVHPELVKALARVGIDALYSHQADAWQAAHRGHVIVTTGTAS